MSYQLLPNQVLKMLTPAGARKKEIRKDKFNVTTGMNYGVASFLSWSKSICNPEIGIIEIRGPLRSNASFLS
jgi:hypothetical protein